MRDLFPLENPASYFVTFLLSPYSPIPLPPPLHPPPAENNNFEIVEIAQWLQSSLYNIHAVVYIILLYRTSHVKQTS